MKEVFLSELTVPTTTEKDNVGDLRCEGEKTYRYVQNISGETAPAGGVAQYDVLVKENAYRGYITKPATAQLAFMAGVIVAEMADDEFGWIQIDGPYDKMSINSGTTVVGGDIIAVDADWDGGEGALGTVTTGQLGRINCTEIVTATTVDVVINCINV